MTNDLHTFLERVVKMRDDVDDLLDAGAISEDVAKAFVEELAAMLNEVNQAAEADGLGVDAAA